MILKKEFISFIWRIHPYRFIKVNNMYKNKLLGLTAALSMVFSLQACSQKTSESETENNNTEIIVEDDQKKDQSAVTEETDTSEKNSTSKDDSTADKSSNTDNTDTEDNGWKKISDLSDLDPDFNPIVVKDYFVAKDKSGKFIIYDQTGTKKMPGLDGVTLSSDDKLTVTIDEQGKEASLLLSADGTDYDLDYITGESDTNSGGGLGGSMSYTFGYDEGSKEVMKRFIGEDTKWNSAETPQDEPDHPVIIFSDTTLDDCIKNSTFPDASDTYWIWEPSTDTVYGRFTGDEGSVIVDPQENVTYYIEPTRYFYDQPGPYASDALEGAQVVYDAKLSEKSYKKIVPVGWQAVVGTDDNGENDLYTMSSSEFTQLPSAYDSVSAMNGNSILLLKDGTWSLYQLDN